MARPENIYSIDELTIWVEPGSSVHFRIGSPDNEPAELSGDQARDLATVLLRMAAQADE